MKIIKINDSTFSINYIDIEKRNITRYINKEQYPVIVFLYQKQQAKMDIQKLKIQIQKKETEVFKMEKLIQSYNKSKLELNVLIGY